MLAHRISYKIILFIFSSIFSIQSYASLLYLDEQSVSALGNAFAGAGAAGDDVSIGFYNPAGLMLIEEGQVVGAVTYAATDIVLHVDSATDIFGDPFPGVAGEEIFAVPQTPIPALHAAVPINEDWVVGISFTAPYGIITDYSDSALRAETSEIKFLTYNTTLNLAYQLTQKLAIGAGLNVQYMDTLLSTYVAGDNGNGFEEIFFAEYKGDDIAVYPNVGLLYEFTDNTRMGLAYRFPVTHETDGAVENVSIGNGDLAVFPATMQVPLPGIASLSLFHQLTPRIELLGDVTFEGWSRWQNLEIDFLFSENATGVPLHFDDTWRVGLGANYILNSAIKFRTGVAYDESPVKDEYRNMATPDSDRFDISVGMGIAPKSWKKTRLDIGYMHTFFASAPIDQGNIFGFLTGFPDEAPNSNNVVGDYDSAADYIGIQIVRGM